MLKAQEIDSDRVAAFNPPAVKTFFTSLSEAYAAAGIVPGSFEAARRTFNIDETGFQVSCS
jgi:hypothetical protein